MSGMHLLPVFYSTTNTKKRKVSKKTKSQLAAERKHEKFLKKMGISSRSSAGLEQRSSKPWVTGSSPVESTKPKVVYDSSMSKKKENVYTGTEIIGIAQMHKSNAVPIRGKKQAEEVAQMRRN
jgi:hypothetical protein|tara:strand:- start:570 stop:938 length:369 start_codon:yes stop_codon:yes gene_type:complete